MAEPVFRIVAYGSSDYAETVALREDVLRKPLGMAFTPEDIAEEKEFIHVSGFVDGSLCASCMLVPENEVLRVKRVAVKDGLRGTGICGSMMKYCEAYALGHGFRSVYCHARHTAVRFYTQCGWLPEGEPFVEISIPHLKMRKVLSNY